MTKKITTISIDEKILVKAKKEIPNLSIFVEDCLKSYLGFDNTNIKGIDENMLVIKKALLDIHILSSKDDVENVEKVYTVQEQNRVWNNLFGKFRNNEDISVDDFEKSSKILNVSVKDLKELLENIEFNFNGNDLIQCNEWSFAKKQL